MNIIVGAFSSAFLKSSRIFFSDSPYHFEVTSGPLRAMKFTPASFATTLARSVFPVPGGPNRRMPLGGSTPSFRNSSGCLSGSSIISLTFFTSSRRPPTSS